MNDNEKTPIKELDKMIEILNEKEREDEKHNATIAYSAFLGVIAFKTLLHAVPNKQKQKNIEDIFLLFKKIYRLKDDVLIDEATQMINDLILKEDRE